MPRLSGKVRAVNRKRARLSIDTVFNPNLSYRDRALPGKLTPIWQAKCQNLSGIHKRDAVSLTQFPFDVTVICREIKTQDRCRADIRADTLSQSHISHFAKLAAGKSLADVRPSLLQAESRVDVAYQDLNAILFALTCRLNVVFKDMQSDGVGVPIAQYRPSQKLPVLAQPGAPASQSI
ncbi:hypothetical protein K663_01960 [Sphingobium sp. MI1205]|nr:hypothetical protein K663_01960 [Sphingobium sp. MI1205]